MIDPHAYSLFLLTALVLVLTPGPDTVLILSRTLASGQIAGLLTLLGTQTGNVVHALLAGLGVSSLILIFPLALHVLKYVGAAYLVFLAVKAWRASGHLALDERLNRKRTGNYQYFRQGLTNNLFNPKMVPFFVALFPQFIHPEGGSVALQSLVLGSTLAGMALIWIGALTIFVSRLREIGAASQTFLTLANRFAALTFFGLAVRLAAEDH